MKKTILVLASFFMLFGVLIFFVIAFNENFLNTFLDIDGDAAANVGSFFGGIVGAIFSLIGVLLVIYSILLINDETQKNNVREYFFKMLDYYKEDVRALSFGRFKESSPGRAEGKQAISHFRENLKENYKLVNNIIKENNYQIDNLDRNRLLYEVTIAGLLKINGETGVLLTNTFGNKYSFFGDLLKQIFEEFVKLRETGIKLNRGYRASLASYFRNIYEMIKLIDANNVLSIKEKYELIDIFKAQLSNNEGHILFYNSISLIGGDWTRNDYIMKYKLLDFIPDGYFWDENPYELLQQAKINLSK